MRIHSVNREHNLKITATIEDHCGNQTILLFDAEKGELFLSASYADEEKGSVWADELKVLFEPTKLDFHYETKVFGPFNNPEGR